jgi:hypothetical protein
VPLTSDATRLLALIREVFRRRGDRWFLFGAQAVVAHGFPRTTGDVDVIGDGTVPVIRVEDLIVLKVLSGLLAQEERSRGVRGRTTPTQE